MRLTRRDNGLPLSTLYEENCEEVLDQFHSVKLAYLQDAGSATLPTPVSQANRRRHLRLRM